MPDVAGLSFCDPRGLGALARMSRYAGQAGSSASGGAVPCPGGLSVVEADLIAGLTAAGIPQGQAVAAVLM
jgi:uncharacterized membrane protein YbhN (UPF0104 family)